MNLSHAKTQRRIRGASVYDTLCERREGTKNKKGIFGISYPDSATPLCEAYSSPKVWEIPTLSIVGGAIAVAPPCQMDHTLKLHPRVGGVFDHELVQYCTYKLNRLVLLVVGNG